MLREENLPALAANKQCYGVFCLGQFTRKRLHIIRRFTFKQFCDHAQAVGANLHFLQVCAGIHLGKSLGAGTRAFEMGIALGDHAYKVAISSTKSMIGHLLGAAGAVEAIATLLTINRGVIHPTINYENPDPACDLDYVPNQARRQDVRIAISNGFGFGGHNAVVVLKKYEE